MYDLDPPSGIVYPKIYPSTAELLLSEEREPDDLPRLERIVAATADALERVLGAPAGCLQHA